MWFPPPLRVDPPAAWRWLASGAILAIMACSLNDTASDTAYLRLEGSPQLTTYARVVIRLSDTLGNAQVTLYDDSLPSLDRLKKLPADGYAGGPVRISIQGYRNGVLAYSETRLYDGRSQRVLSLDITLRDSASAPVPAPGESVTVPVAAPKAPGFYSLPSDTTVSIRDSVSLAAEAYDSDGDLAAYAWDCNGVTEDTASLAGYRMKIPYGMRFPDPGMYTCTLRLWDKGGRRAQASVIVNVKLDPPVADAGPDTEVVAGTKILLHAKGWDGFGPIVSRSWKIGSQPFVPVTQQETSITAPSVPGDLMCILMVTDSDSLSALDTLVVHVTAP